MQRLASLGLTSACLAHDMGNLLQVAASALQLLERSLSPEAGSRIEVFLGSARSAIDRIGMLRGQILDLARVDPSVLPQVDPVGVIAGMERLIRLTLGPGIRFEWGTAPAGAFTVLCDAQELENAVLNLVTNARDAMPRGGRLCVAIACDGGGWQDEGVVVTEQAQVVLTVRDTGCGMTHEVLQQAFKPFFTTRGAVGGTGLGLPAVAEFARRSGGSVDVESRLGDGTTVTLRLPARRQDGVLGGA